MKAHLQVIFTLDELAAYLKVGKRTLYRLARTGKFRLSRLAGRGGFVKAKSISGSMIRPKPGKRRRWCAEMSSSHRNIPYRLGALSVAAGERIE
ncbi:helix-turn-helix transcriptional regulator [Stutzerimonas balearica]|uniref:helix-turn-helix transcriptional regulator n=1 Tax=Stutzerimonas balearica TaxID=74829 RepID=UPI003D2BB15B|tara:strand:- start:110 stop:391 length:282 start_codon:yes stop_codon:yes gene_type:complete